jgi:hypothetical protein
MENSKQPAFAVSKEMCEMPNGEINIEEYPYGLTKREYFAAKAMQGIFASNAEHDHKDEHIFDAVAEAAYKQADAMLKAREA